LCVGGLYKQRSRGAEEQRGITIPLYRYTTIPLYHYTIPYLDQVVFTRRYNKRERRIVPVVHSYRVYGKVVGFESVVDLVSIGDGGDADAPAAAACH
jgi:hypothetical protein